MTDIASLRKDLTALVDATAREKYSHAAGKAAKDAAGDVARRDLGGDMAMSGMRRKVKLSSGYDLTGTGLTLNLRPAGLWTLADRGRRRVKPVSPRKSGAQALNTPWGPRASVKGSTSRGLHTIDDAEKQVEQDAFKAVDKAITTRLRSF